MRKVLSTIMISTLLCAGTSSALADGPRGDKQRAHSQKQGEASNQNQQLKKHAKAVYCGDNLSEPGLYKFETDLECTASIRITASNVTLDLAGHSLTCLPEAWQYPEPLGVPEVDRNVWVKGINVNFNRFEDPSLEPVVSGVHVRNGSVSNCALGVSFYKTDRSKVTNMTLTDNFLPSECCWGRGIEMVESHNNIIRRNEFARNSQGFAAFSSNGNTFKGNTVQNSSQDGVLLYASSNNKLVHNNSSQNNWGIWLEDSSDNRVRNNKMRDNVQDGLFAIGASTGNSIVKNTAKNNGGAGIVFVGVTVAGLDVGASAPTENLVKGNSAYGNALVDLAEGNLDFSDFTFSSFEFAPGEECRNTWLKNGFDTAVAAANCVE